MPRVSSRLEERVAFEGRFSEVLITVHTLRKPQSLPVAAGSIILVFFEGKGTGAVQGAITRAAFT